MPNYKLSVVAIVLASGLATFAVPASAYPDPEHKCELPRALYKEILKMVDGGRLPHYDKNYVFKTYFDSVLAKNAAYLYDKEDGEMMTGMDGTDEWRIDALTYIPSKTPGEMNCDVIFDAHGIYDDAKFKSRMRFIQKPESGRMKIYNILYGNDGESTGLREMKAPGE